MYSNGNFNPFWVGQSYSGFEQSQMPQYPGYNSMDNGAVGGYNSMVNSGHTGFNRGSFSGNLPVSGEVTPYEQTYNGEYQISDRNRGSDYNRPYGGGQFSGGSSAVMGTAFEGLMEGGYNRRLQGGYENRYQADLPAGLPPLRADKSRGSSYSFGYDNSSSPICFMR